jgi:hypothetical protein
VWSARTCPLYALTTFLRSSPRNILKNPGTYSTHHIHTDRPDHHSTPPSRWPLSSHDVNVLTPFSLCACLTCPKYCFLVTAHPWSSAHRVWMSAVQ